MDKAHGVRTVWTSDLAPDNADLGAPDRPLCPVDVGDALTGVPLCGLAVVDALELKERGTRVGVSLATLVGNVLSLHIH
jgi:hypothetical protein